RNFTRFFGLEFFPLRCWTCSARHVAPDEIALARLPLTAFYDHPLSLGLDQIEHRVAADADESSSLEQRFDLRARAAAEKRQPVADRRIFGAGPGILRRLYQKAWIELAVDHDEPATRTQHPDPFVERRLRMGQCPQYVAADGEIKAGRGKRQ